MTGVELDRTRVLHGQEEYIFHGAPPKAGDVLVGRLRIDKIYEKTGRRGGPMTFIEQVTEYRNGDGRVVVKSRTTIIETSKAATEETGS